jgi:hypothetical protein
MGERPVGRIAGWALLALAGIALAVVLSVAASSLSTQPIGRSAEPLRAGDKLAPHSGGADGYEGGEAAPANAHPDSPADHAHADGSDSGTRPGADDDDGIR